ncbi:MAG: FadR family transcriptional regulator [Polyangiaceae bacterium]|nr:FadR family transcriptional regulator [Polyangiaceae bacterium]
MDLKPEASASVVDGVVKRLMDDVLAGKIPAGGYLSPERDLAAELGVSRVTVRAAIHRLVGWGVIATRQGSGAMVRPRRSWTADALASIVSHAMASGDIDALLPVVGDGLELRRMLVTDLVERAAGRVKKGSLETAKMLVHEAWSARAEPNRFVRLDREILPSMLEAARMWPSLLFLNSMAASYLAVVDGIAPMMTVPASYVPAHLAVLAAVEEGRGAEARRVFSLYLDELDQSLVAPLPTEVVERLFPGRSAGRTPR